MYQENSMQLSKHVQRQVLKFQQTEITEYHIYKRLARKVTPIENARIIEQIAADELRHYNGWKKYTNQDVEPRWMMVWFYYGISILFGFTFGIKLMEQGEEAVQESYASVSQDIPEAKQFQHEEDEHEERLIGMLDEERLQYAGSVVLGLNDALVELTGALAGLTLALQNVKLIALSGLITGIAASMSMAASEYLSTRSEDTSKQPVRAADFALQRLDLRLARVLPDRRHGDAIEPAILIARDEPPFRIDRHRHPRSLLSLRHRVEQLDLEVLRRLDDAAPDRVQRAERLDANVLHLDGHGLAGVDLNSEDA
jgi:hypothetical protein